MVEDEDDEEYREGKSKTLTKMVIIVEREKTTMEQIVKDQLDKLKKVEPTKRSMYEILNELHVVGPMRELSMNTLCNQEKGDWNIVKAWISAMESRAYFWKNRDIDWAEEFGTYYELSESGKHYCVGFSEALG